MKSIKRLLLGVISSVLFAAGLHAAADRVDPMSRSLGRAVDSSALKAGIDCGSYCEISGGQS